MNDHVDVVQASQPDGMSRRTMLAGAAGLTGVVALAGARWAAPANAASAAQGATAAGTPGGYSVSSYDLVVDGVSTPLRSLLGGGAFADVTDLEGQRSLGPVQYEDTTIQTGPPPKLLTPWILAFLGGNPEKRTGQIQSVSSNRVVQSHLSFDDALITEVGFPAVDASAKDTAFLSVNFKSATNKFNKGGEPGSSKPDKQKMWLTQNFKLAIDGLDTSKVNRVEGITVTQDAKGSPVCSALKISLAEGSADGWFAWFESFVVQGNYDDERRGTLTYLNPNGSTLLTLSLEHLGVYRYDLDAPAGPSDAIKRVTFELYVEHIVAQFT